MDRNFARTSRFRRFIRDYEHLDDTMADYHFMAFAWLMLACVIRLRT